MRAGGSNLRTKERGIIIEFIKYFTNPQFDNAKFADMLRLKMNVRAKAVEDGVTLDRDAFNAMSAALMPNWAWLNKQSINSPLHTRPAAPSVVARAGPCLSLLACHSVR